MLKRLLVVTVFALTLMLASVTQAFAWANGGPSRNDYGTHDWVLDKARVLAGTQGRWMNRSAALLASDDPDTYKVPETYHLFHERGLRRGAAQRVADYYYLAVRAYQSGDTTLASTYVGVMSHYYADIVQPFHSAYDARDKQSVHFAYEYDVDDLTRRSSALASWITPRTPRPVTDVRQMTVAAAAYSRAQYPSLYKYYGASRRISGNSATITRWMLNRAANDLADIIRSVPTGSGLARETGSVEATVSIQYPALHAGTGAIVKCLDASGTPIEGAAVTLSWPAVSSTTKVTVFTDKYGVATHWQAIGASPFLRQSAVIASQRTNGRTATGQTWYMTTPALASGETGMRTTYSAIAVKQGSSFTLTTTCVDTLGRYVKGMPLRFRFIAGGSDVYLVDALTDSNGRASVSWDTGDTDPGYVTARVETRAGGVGRSTNRTLRIDP